MEDKRFAVLIDSDNISAKFMRQILDEVASEGIATYKRIYGDWTSPQQASWKEVLLNNSIIPMQQYSYTTGKNATDSAMIIDAMDILYSGNVEGFFLVSSDSDFTRLASRLRESGMFVVGMGERKTPEPFVSACNKFKYLEIPEEELKKSHSDSPQNSKKTKEDPQVAKTSKVEIGRAIRKILREKSDEDGLVSTAEIGSILSKRYPDFDVRDYGYNKLTQFIPSFPMFEVQVCGQTNKQFYAKLKGQ